MQKKAGIQKDVTLPFSGGANQGDSRIHKSPSTERQRRLRIKIIEKLGGKCSCNRNDCWHSAVTLVCPVDDPRALHIDHVNSGGSKELRRGWGGGMKHYYRVLRDTENTYQLLCANCNAAKRYIAGEPLGQRQHKQPFAMKRIPKAPGYKQKPRVF